MKKFGAIVTVIGVVIIVYLILLVVMPWLAEITTSVNTTLNASHNMSLYPGTSDFLISTPWILFFLPGVIGLVVVVLILRYSDN